MCLRPEGGPTPTGAGRGPGPHVAKGRREGDMRKLCLFAGIGVLTACLASWAALRGAQPSSTGTPPDVPAAQAGGSPRLIPQTPSNNENLPPMPARIADSGREPLDVPVPPSGGSTPVVPPPVNQTQPVGLPAPETPAHDGGA